MLDSALADGLQHEHLTCDVDFFLCFLCVVLLVVSLLLFLLLDSFFGIVDLLSLQECFFTLISGELARSIGHIAASSGMTRCGIVRLLGDPEVLGLTL